MDMKTLIKCVRTFAEANYTKDGWDYVVEAYSDKDIEEIILEAKATTPEAAIVAVHSEVKVRDDVRRDIESTAF